MKVLLLKELPHENGVIFPIGSKIEIGDADARRLAASGHIAPLAGEKTDPELRAILSQQPNAEEVPFAKVTGKKPKK